MEWVHWAESAPPAVVTAAGVNRRELQLGRRRGAMDQQHRCRRRWRRRQCVRTFAAKRREHHRTRDLRVQPGHDARGVLQPFVAVGSYSSIGKLARPSSFEFAPVSLEDNPDFNRKSLRSTVVLRWEYVRGSTLFFVWNLASSDTSRPGHLFAAARYPRRVQRPRHNVLAIKINYWLTP